ncbi:LPS export ABC transporter periplasmic protein LptC [bacterium]|nr:LPS export ABC transporter periplasmic protein LptC [bacterium]
MRINRFLPIITICLLMSACATQQIVELTKDTKVQIPRKKSQEKKVVQAKQERLQEPNLDQPARITSDRMQYREQGRVTVFKGKVCVNQVDAWLFSPYLEVRSEKGMAYARQGVRLIDHGRGVTATAREMDYNRDMTHVILRDTVAITSHDDAGETLKMYCDRMRWNENQDAAVADGHVIVHYKDTTATAHTMTYHRLKKMMVLSGEKAKQARHPRVLQGTNTITGELITMHIKDRVYEVEGSAKAIVLPESAQAKVTERKP